VLFLALLELFKLGSVELDQPDHRGALEVARREGGVDLDDLDDLAEQDALDASDDVGESDALGGPSERTTVVQEMP
jgi:chromatin segregation and condensation protein Rec8/ScpA/Scc1 (kleisin family)